MTKNIMIVGVGGQGSLLASKLLGQLLLMQGYDVKVSEVHGMSQRGGDVQSNLRLSTEPIYSDLIPEGEADIIIAMEPMEALRYVPYLRKDGWVVTSSEPLVNIPTYPDIEKVTARLKALPNVRLLPIGKMAREAKTPKSANMLLLGMTADLIGLVSPEELKNAIAAVFARKGQAVVEANLQAFAIGQGE